MSVRESGFLGFPFSFRGIAPLNGFFRIRRLPLGHAFFEVISMLPEIELLQYIYKTTDMGCQGIDTVEGHAEKRLKDELSRERAEYERIKDEADRMIRGQGDTPGGVGEMAKLSAEMMSAGQLAMDDSRGRIAEMMIKGTTMGIVKTIRHLNSYEGENKEARQLGQRLLKAQESNVERMKAYL